MKYIVKQDEPQLFTEWKLLANDDWQPAYNELSGNTKKAVKDALMTEQGYICCYCERRLKDSDSHVEHFQPQNDSATDALDFSNMLCSCQNQLKKGEPRHCGNLKDDWFDCDLLVSPFDPVCEKRFSFTGDGAISPADDSDQAAIETVYRLGLNIPKLNALRASVIEPFLDDALSIEELQSFVSGYLTRDTSEQFGEFWTTIRYLFMPYDVAE
ncbi:MAG: retron system putative HNH endonuclease [Thermodesulfobacteriota bacterium]|nr:retron system putative HNH endonuclease [Thermodesulfobacteriota bacterium]